MSKKGLETPYETLVGNLRRAVCGEGELERGIREDLVQGDTTTGGELVPLATKVAKHAYRVVDEDFDALRRVGYTEDQLMEVVIAAAVGAGLTRLETASSIIRAAQEDEPACD